MSTTTSYEIVAALYRRSDLPSKDRSRHWITTVAPSFQSFNANDSTGKWCIFRPDDEIDAAWEVIAGLAKGGLILCAKVSTRLGRDDFPSHVICVYTRDWADAADLHATREVLREASFGEELGYKRDIDTRRGIYGPYEWYLRA